MAKETSSTNSRQPRGKTVSFDNLEALFTKKAVEAYIETVETQTTWPAGNIFSKEEVIEKLECVIDKFAALPYFSAAAAPRKGTVAKTTATKSAGVVAAS